MQNGGYGSLAGIWSPDVFIISEYGEFQWSTNAVEWHLPAAGEKPNFHGNFKAIILKHIDKLFDICYI